MNYTLKSLQSPGSISYHWKCCPVCRSLTLSIDIYFALITQHWSPKLEIPSPPSPSWGIAGHALPLVRRALNTIHSIDPSIKGSGHSVDWNYSRIIPRRSECATDPKKGFKIWKPQKNYITLISNMHFICTPNIFKILHAEVVLLLFEKDIWQLSSRTYSF